MHAHLRDADGPEGALANGRAEFDLGEGNPRAEDGEWKVRRVEGVLEVLSPAYV